MYNVKDEIFYFLGEDMKNFFKFILLIFIIFFTACSNISNKNFSQKEKIFWREVNLETKFENLDLQTGDIIIKEKEKNPEGIFGHTAIMANDKMVFDYPKIGEKSYYMRVEFWLEEGRKILILRYKEMDEKFAKKLLENMKKYFGKSYKIHSNKLNEDGFYCSQYVWYVYYITAKELGYELDLDSDGGNFVLPYDFINSKYLDIVK